MRRTDVLLLSIGLITLGYVAYHNPKKVEKLLKLLLDEAKAKKNE